MFAKWDSLFGNKLFSLVARLRQSNVAPMSHPSQAHVTLCATHGLHIKTPISCLSRAYVCSTTPNHKPSLRMPTLPSGLGNMGSMSATCRLYLSLSLGRLQPPNFCKYFRRTGAQHMKLHGHATCLWSWLLTMDYSVHCWTIGAQPHFEHTSYQHPSSGQPNKCYSKSYLFHGCTVTCLYLPAVSR